MVAVSLELFINNNFVEKFQKEIYTKGSAVNYFLNDTVKREVIYNTPTVETLINQLDITGDLDIPKDLAYIFNKITENKDSNINIPYTKTSKRK